MELVRKEKKRKERTASPIDLLALSQVKRERYADSVRAEGNSAGKGANERDF